MPKKKQPTLKQTDFNPPKEGDKYTLETTLVYEYLSIHEHDDVQWQVTAIVPMGDKGYAVEFTRKNK
jgi:hypothetical protein